MQIGGALGSTCGWLLRVDPRERRILMVSGVAAGIAAVFRTPLGAALLAVEVLYRDDFESDALIPAVLASVVAYSVVISIFGEVDAVRAPRRAIPFIIKHLRLYGAAGADGVGAGGAVPVVAAHRAARDRVAAASRAGRARRWAGWRSASSACRSSCSSAGALAQPGQGLGLLGGGYGAVAGGDQRRQLAAHRLGGRRAAARSCAWPRSSRRR